jgi:hypothetical protein
MDQDRQTYTYKSILHQMYAHFTSLETWIDIVSAHIIENHN